MPARFEESFADLTASGYYKTHPIPDPRRPNQWLADPEGAARERIAAPEKFFALHSEFADRDELCWRLAPLCLVTGRAQDAAETYRKYQAEGRCGGCREFARMITAELVETGMAK